MIIITDLGQFCQMVAEISLREYPQLMKLLRSGSLSETERFKIVWNLHLVQENDFGEPRLKSKELSKQMREKGNEFCKKGEIPLAATFYGYAICTAPYPQHSPLEKDTTTSTEELALAYANRSTIAFAMERYHYSLYDAARALYLDYPTHLQQKMYDRMGVCFLKMNEFGKAAKYFREAKTKCDDETKRSEYETKIVKAEKQGNKKKRAKSTLNVDYFPIPWSKIPSVAGGPNAKIPSVSTAVKLMDSDKGKKFTAARDIEPGEVILVESPVGWGLVIDKMVSNCSHCFRCFAYLIPCQQCTIATYCSEKCQMASWDEYHKMECHVLSAIFESVGEAFLELYLPLTTSVRAVLSSLVTFLNEFEKFGCKNEADKESFLEKFVSENKQEAFLIGSDWYHFATALFPPEQQIKLGALAAVVTRTLLQKTSLLEELSKTSFVEAMDRAYLFSQSLKTIQPTDLDDSGINTLESDFAGIAMQSDAVSREVREKLDRVGEKLFAYVGSAIMHQMHTIQLSGRQICEDRQSDEDVELTPIGFAAYKYAGQLTHSCVPNAVEVSYGRTIVVTATETIRKSETVTVAHTSHLMYDVTPLAKRRWILQAGYKIDCQCRACSEKWPTLEEFRERERLEEKQVYGKSALVCRRCSDRIPARQRVRNFANTSDTAHCMICGFSKPSELTQFTKQEKSWRAVMQPYYEKVRCGTATAADAAKLLKSTGAFQKEVEKYFSRSSQMHYTLWDTMKACSNRMGNYCNPKKQFDP